MLAIRSRFLSVLLAAVCLTSAAACGGGDDGPSREEAAATLAASFSSLGVQPSETERSCVSAKIAPGLLDTELGATDLKALGQESRVALAEAAEECFSKENLALLVPKTVANEAGLSVAASACLQEKHDGSISYLALIKQERAAVAAIAKLVRECASAQ